MILYRCNPKSSGAGDYSTTYTAKIDNVTHLGSCAFKYSGNSTYTPSSTLTIGNNVERCDSMFFNSKVNCDVVIGNKVSIMHRMFANTNYGKNVYLKGTSYRFINVNSMFANCNNSIRKNIFFHSSFNNKFNLTTTDSVVGGSITWATMTNGFYNATYNVYCYNNYSG